MAEYKSFNDMLNDIDKDATAKLFLRNSTCNMDYFVGILQEVAVVYGFNLLAGDRVVLHPKNVPDHLRKQAMSHHILMVSAIVDEGNLEFIPMKNLGANSISNLRII